MEQRATTSATRLSAAFRAPRLRSGVVGAVLGLAVVLAYGDALAAGVHAVWTGAVLPAFLALGASGLPLCG